MCSRFTGRVTCEARLVEPEEGDFINPEVESKETTPVYFTVMFNVEVVWPSGTLIAFQKFKETFTLGRDLLTGDCFAATVLARREVERMLFRFRGFPIRSSIADVISATANTNGRDETYKNCKVLRMDVDVKCISFEDENEDEDVECIPDNDDEVETEVVDEDEDELMEDEDTGMVPASKSSIEELQTVKVQDVNDQLTEPCSICMEAICFGSQTIKRLPCSHLFHGSCIVSWLNESNLCPLCRSPLPT